MSIISHPAISHRRVLKENDELLYTGLVTRYGPQSSCPRHSSDKYTGFTFTSCSEKCGISRRQWQTPRTLIKVENNLLWVPFDPASAVRRQKIEHHRHGLFFFGVNQSRAKIKYNLTSEVKDYSENETSIYKSWQLGSLCVYTRNDVCIYCIHTRTRKCWLANKAYHCHACVYAPLARDYTLYTLVLIFQMYVRFANKISRMERQDALIFMSAEGNDLSNDILLSYIVVIVIVSFTLNYGKLIRKKKKKKLINKI